MIGPVLVLRHSLHENVHIAADSVQHSLSDRMDFRDNGIDEWTRHFQKIH